jgi:serine/threonine protein kinase
VAPGWKPELRGAGSQPANLDNSFGTNPRRWHGRRVSSDSPSTSPHLSGLDPSALIRLGLEQHGDDGPFVVPGYEIIESLGRGGMGEVFRARQESLGREVAVKVLRADLPATGWLPERFEREARTMAALDHPNLVTVHDSLQLADGRTAIVMELVRGGALRRRIEDSPGGLSTEQALTWTSQIAAGLGAAHAAGIVHRDVKPENVLLDDHGTARVTDFGMAFSSAPDSTRYTQTGTALGTLGYMAPEQLRGSVADARADVFSLGVMLYEMLTGRLPQGSFSRASELRRGVPRRVDAIVSACLRPEPERRLASMTELLRMLDEVEKAPRTRWIPRRRAVGAALAASVAGAGYWWWSNRPAEDPPWRRIAWPQNPSAAAIMGAWRIEDGALISDDTIAIVPVAQHMPAAFLLRLRFVRLSGDVSIGVFFKNARGTAVCTLAGRGRNRGGLQMVDGRTLDDGDFFEMRIVNGRLYEWEIEIRPESVRMWVDGELKDVRDIAGKPLDVPGTWVWRPEPGSPALLLGSWQSSTRFESLEWKPLNKR